MHIELQIMTSLESMKLTEKYLNHACVFRFDRVMTQRRRLNSDSDCSIDSEGLSTLTNLFIADISAYHSRRAQE